MRNYLQLEVLNSRVIFKSIFQVSKISKPLWSVGRLCDAGYAVTFGKEDVVVKQNGAGKIIGNFPRRNGLYLGTL